MFSLDGNRFRDDACSQAYEAFDTGGWARVATAGLALCRPLENSGGRVRLDVRAVARSNLRRCAAQEKYLIDANADVYTGPMQSAAQVS